MTRRQIRLIRSSWKTAGEEPLTLGILFYDRLFNLSPETRAVFRTPVSQQTVRLMHTVGSLVNRLDLLDESLIDITRIADEYARQGLKAMNYPAIASSLIWAMEKKLDQSWNRELAKAWLSFFGCLSTLVKKSAGHTYRPLAVTGRHRLAMMRPEKLSFAS
jgi:nitric oxide dioxygenase